MYKKSNTCTGLLHKKGSDHSHESVLWDTAAHTHTHARKLSTTLPVRTAHESCQSNVSWATAKDFCAVALFEAVMQYAQVLSTRMGTASSPTAGYPPLSAVAVAVMDRP